MNKYLIIFLFSILLLLGTLAIVKISRSTPEKPVLLSPTPTVEIELQGKLRIVIGDNFQDKKSQTQYLLDVNNAIYTLHFSQNPPPLSSGSIIKVKGTLINHDLFIKN